MSSASAFEESVQARMDAIKFQKEQDLIEIEARRRLNIQKKNEAHSKKKAAMKKAKVDNEAAEAANAAVFENEKARIEKAQAKADAEAEEEKRVKIMGFNARIRTIQRDIDVCLDRKSVV